MIIEVKREPVHIAIGDAKFSLSEDEARELLIALNAVLKVYSPWPYQCTYTGGSPWVPPNPNYIEVTCENGGTTSSGICNNNNCTSLDSPNVTLT